MARSRETKTEEPKPRRSELTGILLASAAALLLAALYSFDKYDLASIRTPPNQPAHNWIGPAGAHLAYWLFSLFGGGAFLIPVFLFCGALALFVEEFRYLLRRWPWAAALLLICSAGLDWATNLDALDRLARGLPSPEAGWAERLSLNLNAPSAGGAAGLLLNRRFLSYFGRVGSALILITGYLLSLYGLTNFHLGAWLLEAVRRLGSLLAGLWTRLRGLSGQRGRVRREAAVAEETLGEALKNPFKGKGEAASPRIIDFAESSSVGSAPEKPQPQKKRVKEPAPVAPSKAKTEAAPAPAGKAASSKAPKRALLTVARAPIIADYRLPPTGLLQPSRRPPRAAEESKSRLMARARVIQETLAQFGIQVALGDITRGPTITRYELHPAPGVKLEKIVNLTNNLAAALRAERIHVLAPVPGKGTVGVEVPNRIKATVSLRELFESEEWQYTDARIPLALGKDVYGRPIIADLAEMPHLLIAGSTGSGKSVSINAIIASLLYRFSPDELRFVMIDPKVVELQHYNSLPHLVAPVVTDPKKVILALRWVVSEMEKRYQIFAKVGVRNIHSFNERPRAEPPPPEPKPAAQEKEESGEGFAVEVDQEITVPRDEEIEIPDKLSYIVVIIDELADLMLVAPADVEMAIARITQMARAAGIHCIIATQRPSVDVITGVIKANIPCRIAFQVASKVDSRTILDAMGADKLLGKGDMLYLPPGSATLIRAQGAFVTDKEIEKLVEFIAHQGEPSYDLEIHQQLSQPVSAIEREERGGADEELVQKAIEVIRSEQKASVSLLQRRLGIGYPRAARLMDELESRGIVGPSKGAEPRDILIDLDAQPGGPPPEEPEEGKGD